jgi:hypothetical protein
VRRRTCFLEAGGHAAAGAECAKSLRRDQSARSNPFRTWLMIGKHQHLPRKIADF